jgi:hypothetical protein
MQRATNTTNRCPQEIWISGQEMEEVPNLMTIVIVLKCFSIVLLPLPMNWNEGNAPLDVEPEPRLYHHQMTNDLTYLGQEPWL